ncbi:DMT family transporter [Nanoarchaeota archaeon]
MKGTIMTLIGAILLGLIGPIVKVIGGEVNPYAINFYRMVFAFLFLLALSPLYKDKLLGLTRPQLTDKFILGFLMAAGFSLWVAAFNYAPVSNVTLIGVSQAVFAGMLGYFMLNEKINRVEIYSFILAFIGLVIINPFDASYSSGNVLAIISSLFFSLMIVFMKKRGKVHTFRTLLYSFFFAAVFLSPSLLLENASPIPHLGLILFLGIASTGIAYLLIIFGLRKVEVEAESLIILITVPLVGILLSVSFLGEQLVPRVIIGGIILIMAAIVVLKGKTMHIA